MMKFKRVQTSTGLHTMTGKKEDHSSKKTQVDLPEHKPEGDYGQFVKIDAPENTPLYYQYTQQRTIFTVLPVIIEEAASIEESETASPSKS